MNELVRRCIEGDVRAAARLITLLESQDRDAYAALYRLKDHAGRAQVIGITGPPGAGKSTLADKLITQFRARGLRVGVLAVDPSSPFSGGAILGDRLRMQGHATDTESSSGASRPAGASAVFRRRRTPRFACSTRGLRYCPCRDSGVGQSEST